MSSSTVSPTWLRKILLLDKITVRILGKLSALHRAAWVNMPIQWDGKNKRLYTRPPSETFLWNTLQYFNFIGTIYYLSFILLTMKYGIKVETWKILFFTFLVIAVYCVDVVYFAVAREYREMALCTISAFKLPKGFSSLISTTRKESLMIELISTGILVFFFSLVVGLAITKAVKCPQNIKSLIRRGAFGRAIRTHTLIQFLFILINEIGSVAHPGMYAVGFFGLIVTGTATVMGRSFLSVSLFPGMFCILLSWVLTVSSHVVAIYDQSILFKVSWLTEVEGKLARMQLRACKEAKLILHGMGFLDRSFVTTFINGVINNMVNLVVLVGGN
ncbi:unnamed protein product [Orchesella dallaii]|uniref:Gustatory receptor n=1 Tax=Orchesella dallaii TaxID=48710 RepID=A0ABP1Q352_9HEXA